MGPEKPGRDARRAGDPLIYSPSRGGTQDYQRCPRLYDLSRRWQTWSEFNPDMAMGNIIHAGLAAHYSTMWQAPSVLKGMSILDVLVNTLEQEWSGEGQEKALKLASACVKEAISIDLLGKTGRVLAVEQEMGPEKCHPDLVLQHTDWTQDEPPGEPLPYNWLQVIDWKFSWTLKPEWVAKRLASYETSWQLKHYAWRVQQEFNLPCTQVTIVQMAAEPKPMARRIDFPITPESLAAWEASATEWWKLMADGPYPQNYNGCRKYGENYLCPMYAGCHTLHSDESKFSSLYRRKV